MPYDLKVGSSYFGAAFDPHKRDAAIEFVRDARERMAFDTVVVTGISGVVMGGLIAHALGLNLLIVRKEDDLSTHSWTRVEGTLGQRWAFLDDFIETGDTRARVIREVRALAANHEVTSRFVGTVTYEDARAYNGRNLNLPL